MPLTFWSPKGGSGTSVFAAACALALARNRAGGARLVDLAGDQPAILGLPADPEPGLSAWLATGPEAPTDALDRLAVEVSPSLDLLAAGRAEPDAPAPAAEAGAALAAALAAGERPVVVDAGQARDAASRALIEVAGSGVVVVHPCYLALRRAVASPLLARCRGVVLVEEPGRALTGRDVHDVLRLPVLARVPMRAATARAVDAGVLATRVPSELARAASAVLRAVGAVPAGHGEAA